MVLTREIYISAVASELRVAREAVAESLRRLGYIPVWHEFSDQDSADSRPQVARRIRRCKAVIQIVGMRYGPEPSLSKQLGGRTSYAQYEALCARAVDQPVWHFILDDQFPVESSADQPADMEQLQLTYRRRVESFANFSRPVSSLDQLRAEVSELRADFVRIRRRTFWRRMTAFLGRLGFHRLGLNGHPADETSRTQG